MVVGSTGGGGGSGFFSGITIFTAATGRATWGGASTTSGALAISTLSPVPKRMNRLTTSQGTFWNGRAFGIGMTGPTRATAAARMWAWHRPGR